MTQWKLRPAVVVALAALSHGSGRGRLRGWRRRRQGNARPPRRRQRRRHDRPEFDDGAACRDNDGRSRYVPGAPAVPNAPAVPSRACRFPTRPRCPARRQSRVRNSGDSQPAADPRHPRLRNEEPEHECATLDPARRRGAVDRRRDRPAGAGVDHRRRKSIGCGNAVAADTSEAEAANNKTVANVPILNQIVPHTDYVANCQAAVSSRRTWSIPLTVVGALAVLGSLAVPRTRTVS